MNNEEGISSKKLTLQGFNKLKFGLDLSYPVSPNIGATIVKKEEEKSVSQKGKARVN